MTARADAARATLARLGLDAALPDAAALAARLDGADGVALADALAEAGDADAAARLVDAAALVATKAAHKAVRRALFRLRQRGVAVPEAAPEPPAPVRLAAPDVDALVSGIDGRGDRLVWMMKPQSGGGVLVVAVELNEPAGLRDVSTFETTRKQVRETRERIQRETGMRLVPADFHALDALCVEAHERAPEHDRRHDYLRLRGRLTHEPPTSAVELRPSLAPPDDDEAARLCSEAVALLAEPEFRGWWPAPETAAPFLDEIAQVRDSPLVLGRAQQEDRVRAVFERAAATLFPREVTARRLEANAFVLAASARTQAARTALATADAIRRAGPLAEPPPLVQALVQRGLAALHAERQSARDAERAGSLVMTPGEALRPRSPSRPGRTPA